GLIWEMKERHRHTAGHPRIQRNWRYWHTGHFKIQRNRRCTAYMILFKIQMERYNTGTQFESQRKAATPGYTTLLKSESGAHSGMLLFSKQTPYDDVSSFSRLAISSSASRLNCLRNTSTNMIIMSAIPAVIR